MVDHDTGEFRDEQIGMLEKIIFWSLNNRLAVLSGAAVIVLAGLFSLQGMNFDAFPDTTPVQVQINTDCPALVATEVERLVTFPIEALMGGMPGLAHVRSISQFGVSREGQTEVVQGIAPGEAVVSAGSYVLKSEMGREQTATRP